MKQSYIMEKESSKKGSKNKNSAKNKDTFDQNNDSFFVSKKTQEKKMPNGNIKNQFSK